MRRTVPAIFDVVTFSILGIALSGIGRWGMRHTAELINVALPVEEQKKRERVLWRGSVTCQTIGACFIIASVFRMLI